MDFQRLLLFIALSLVLLMMYQAWQEDYNTPAPPTQTAPPQSGPSSASVPDAGVPAPNASASAADVPAQAADAAVPTARQGLPSAGRVHVTTDVYDLEIDTRGGDLRRVDLLQYPVSLNQPDNPIRLLNDQPGDVYVAQAALASASGPEAPTHHAQFKAERDRYTLRDGQDELQVRLTWQGPDGLEVAKVYTFHRGSYEFEVALDVTNHGAEPWHGLAYRQLQRTQPEDTSTFIYTYTGGVVSSPDEGQKRYEKISFDDMEDNALDREMTTGWLAMIEHYFLSAWVPPAGDKEVFYSKVIDGSRYILGAKTPTTSVAPGASATFAAQMFVGPKLQERLEAVAPYLDRTVDYGFLDFIARPVYWALELIHDLVGNWGWSIIIITLLIKLAFFKLSATSYKSMANMRKMQPRLQAIKERYGDDRQKLNEAMMRMYKEEKINPLSGCLPILVQIPVFIALYWVLLESVELRQAPFILWLNDLSTKDPYFVLPILMGLTMLLQHRLNPTPMDPIQAKVMMALPLVFTVFFAFFPSGLVLYWVTNNTLSIAQQWYITRHVVKA